MNERPSPQQLQEIRAKWAEWETLNQQQPQAFVHNKTTLSVGLLLAELDAVTTPPPSGRRMVEEIPRAIAEAIDDYGVVCANVVKRRTSPECENWAREKLDAAITTLVVERDEAVGDLAAIWKATGADDDQSPMQGVANLLAHLDHLTRERERVEHKVELLQRTVDRYLPCPDHRDKVDGSCLVCALERARTTFFVNVEAFDRLLNGEL